MEDEAWRSVDVIKDKKGEPHVLQQKVKVYTAGVTEESSGYTRPMTAHRLVPLTDVTK
ncbi:hypothetical protein VB773_01290 [Haloarculaceae archaeon H-GB2-1]|nr:hypothetical protein [Haloarculaceae archaeon H-GB1-1]MEA5388304.1 hypothetical protein [Haloarculaceae archaeon H-GB11]MEA5406349.1 hypothetical protein [Haloarculaceae archaeon H-GB2-1]